MSKIYLPYAAQFDSMNEHLANIANALAMDMDISTWAGIQKAVRVGVAPDLIPVGTQLEVNHSNEKHLYDVVAHNYYKSAHDKNAHTMTLMCHDALATVQFDAPEAFFYADAYLPEGTYNFTIDATYSSWEAGTYEFQLIDPIPKGAQLCLSGNASTPITSLCVLLYPTLNASPYSSGAITKGNGGTSLGTFGAELNHLHRVSYGSNNYKESAIRQFLNSSSPKGSVWVPKTKYDRPPSWKDSFAGFAGGFDADFLSVVGEVVVPCSTNNTYESPDSTTVKGGKYNVVDKFYLASQNEVYGTMLDIVADDSVLLPYYEGATNADRIKYMGGVTGNVWLRSAHYQHTRAVRIVGSDGSLNNGLANNALGFAPVCTIV